jgi:predicted AAA+ superfamily ATPase
VYLRKHVSTVQQRLSEPRSRIIALTGPRQVGKTTIIRQALEGAHVPVIYENADGLVRSSDGWIADIWARARAAANGSIAVLVIDEVQKVEQWSEAVKREWDADTWNGVDVRVVVLGSSTLLINSGLRESLAGRFERIRVMPWSYEESRDAFGMSLDEYAVYGGYPGAAPYMHDTARWMAYMMDSIIEPVILKDILQLQRVDKPSLLRQLFMTGAQMSAREVSYTKLLGQLQDRGNTSTIVHYLELLEEAGILCGLHKYSTAVMKRRSSPKLNVLANGIATACGSGWSQSMPSDLRGRCMESMVGAHLLTQVDGTTRTLSWWRDGNAEVDFVIHGPRSLTAIEVASGEVHHRRGLEAFRSLYPHARTMLVGAGGIPIDEFMRMPIEEYTADV